ncbi:hypothetical protein GGQ68_001415 [Sagittula marina]|uniref:Phasin domain-containing protein n=1 Tax=Sagittula marina TaxID=943940 RepID=A0A7W6DKU2_9RHOB|nr:hypothetical protein [Sagittula marina]MBB3985086.1 hypothetical protein [Sagittula marina]
MTRMMFLPQQMMMAQIQFSQTIWSQYINTTQLMMQAAMGHSRDLAENAAGKSADAAEVMTRDAREAMKTVAAAEGKTPV